MTKHWIARIAFVLLYALNAGTATASCVYREQVGFIHAAAKHLPANARGAIFLPLQGAPAPPAAPRNDMV